jgi:hypothetical protein
MWTGSTRPTLSQLNCWSPSSVEHQAGSVETRQGHWDIRKGPKRPSRSTGTSGRGCGDRVKAREHQKEAQGGQAKACTNNAHGDPLLSYCEKMGPPVRDSLLGLCACPVI